MDLRRTAYYPVMNDPSAAPPHRPFHHTDDGFRNNYPAGWRRGSFWKWQRDRWIKGVAKPPPGGWRFPSEIPNRAWLRANRSEPTVTWLGHSTFLVQIDGVNVLTDPHLSPRASPFKSLGPRRWMPPAIEVEALPHIDVALVSHNHYDHLDEWTVTRLARQAGGAPRYMVPLRLAAWFTRRGLDTVTELDWWQSYASNGLRLTFTPVQHWSARSAWDRDRTLWGGWRLDHRDFSFFFAGDCGYSTSTTTLINSRSIKRGFHPWSTLTAHGWSNLNAYQHRGRL